MKVTLKKVQPRRLKRDGDRCDNCVGLHIEAGGKIEDLPLRFDLNEYFIAFHGTFTLDDECAASLRN